MNTYKFLTTLVAVTLLSFSQLSLAETPPFKVVETASSYIRVSEDGTGIVKNIRCQGCDFNIVEITGNTRATENGKEVSIHEIVGKRKVVMVSFDPDTREVQFVRW